MLNLLLKEVEGILKLDGPKAVLVSKASATQCTTDRLEYPISRNHADMVKFEDGSEDYRRVRDSLLDLDKTARDLRGHGAD
jgi:hypothetical protein